MENKDVVIITTGVLSAGCVAYMLHYVYRRSQYNGKVKERNKKLKEEKEKLLNLVQNDDKVINEVDNLTTMRVRDLLAGVEAKAISPVAIVKAFQLKAILKDANYNFIADLNPHAVNDAVECPNSKRNGLRGIPISLKESFTVYGCRSTFGLPSNLMMDNTESNDCILVKTLRMQGAIPLMLTNMVEGDLGGLECSNPIYNSTSNPYDPKRSTGGSCGGEATALAIGASILGIGDDQCGELRIPAHFCGVFSMKPTSKRISRRFIQWKYSQQTLIVPSPGLMARIFEDLHIFFKAVACGDLYHLDPYSPPLCFNDKIFEKKRPLRIGYYIELEGSLCSRIPPIPAVTRALKVAKEILTNSGHAVMEFNLPNVDYAIYDLYLKAIYMDGGASQISELIGYNPVDSSVGSRITMLKLPNLMKRFLGLILTPVNPPLGKTFTAMSGVKSSYDAWNLNKRIEQYRETVLNMWQELKLDGLICPVYPIVAPLKNSMNFSLDMVCYTAIYNLLDYSTGVVPLTRVTLDDINELLNAYPKKNSYNKYVHETQTDGTEGLPVGVQCVSLMWREETCLRMMRDIANGSEFSN